MQDTLTDEMVGLAAGLKRNAAAMEGAVRERGRLLDSAETMLDGNLHGTQRSVRESKAVRTRRAEGVSEALHTLLICLTVAQGCLQGLKACRTQMEGTKCDAAASGSAPVKALVARSCPCKVSDLLVGQRVYMYR